MSDSFLQNKLDEPIRDSSETILMLHGKMDELKAQIAYYEEREIEHKQGERQMQNAYRSFIEDCERLKKQLSLMEIRCGELKAEKNKIQAELSGQVEVLLNERKLYEELNGKVWFTFDKHQLNMLGYLANNYNGIQVNLDLDNRTFRTIMPSKEPPKEVIEVPAGVPINDTDVS